jgi:superfamily II DNA/RNA helicase
LPVLTFKDIPKGTSQSYIRVPSRLKITTLTALVEEKAIPRLVVYTASKRGSDRLFRVFKSQQRQVVRVNSRQSVEERTEMMGRFNSGDADLILVSEVSTQDIDLNGVDYLINYDVPDTFSDYVLRMQRAKTSQNLQVVSLVSDTDTEAIERLQDKQPDTLPEWPLPERAQKKFEEKKARAARSDDRQPRKPRGKRGGRPKERTNTSSEEKNSKPPSRDNRPRRKNSPVDRAKDQKSAPKTNRPPKRKKRTEAAKLTELPKADFAALDRQKEKKKGGILGKIKSWFN